MKPPGAGRSGVTPTPGVGPGHLTLDAISQLIEGSLDGVAVLDEALRVAYVNEAGCDILGRPLDELIGRTGLLAVSPERRRATRENLSPAMMGSQSRGATVRRGADARRYCGHRLGAPR